MFVSFFSRPLALTVSAGLWAAFAVGFWYTFGSQTGELLGFHLQASGTKTVGAAVFWSAQFLWFYLYFCRGGGVVRGDLDVFIPPPVVTLVDSWISVDSVHFLLPGSG